MEKEPTAGGTSQAPQRFLSLFRSRTASHRRLGCDGELQWGNVGRESRGREIGAMLVREIGFWFVEQLVLIFDDGFIRGFG